MLTFLLLVAGFIGLFVLGWRLIESRSGFLGFAGGTMCVISIIFTLILVFGVPGTYYEYKAEISKFKMVQATVTAARESSETSSLELAAIAQSIVEANEWLAEARYWKGTIGGLAIPDEILELEPIR